jgi:homoserine dehydrogenase
MAAPLGIALLGCGTVGTAVANALLDPNDMLDSRAGGPLELRRVALRDVTRSRDVDLAGLHVSDDARATALADDIDIVVELMGGSDPAGEIIGAALDSGRAVVTANKAVMAASGPSLATRVQPSSGGLGFEAAVCAAIPILATLRDSLRGERITAITGVVNGTTNFMLERMRAGRTYAAALAEAQRLGYAEADPTADVAGVDASQKLALLAWFGFGAAATADSVTRRGIDSLRDDDLAVAQELGGTVRLVAHAEREPRWPGPWSMAVQPAFVPAEHPLAALAGPENAVIVHGDLAGDVLLRGAGAGAGPTASAVLSDLVRVAELRREGRSSALPEVTSHPAVDSDAAEAAALLRVAVHDDPEAAQIVAQMLEDRGLEVEAVSERIGGSGREVVVLTRRGTRGALGRAVDSLETIPVVREVLSTLDRLEGPA